MQAARAKFTALATPASSALSPSSLFQKNCTAAGTALGPAFVQAPICLELRCYADFADSLVISALPSHRLNRNYDLGADGAHFRKNRGELLAFVLVCSGAGEFRFSLTAR